jgi:hypothetical protein
MKSITITLDEQTAEWARQHAAERRMSLSRYLGEILMREMPRARSYEQARQAFLGQKPYLRIGPDEKLPTREEVHDRSRVR